MAAPRQVPVYATAVSLQTGAGAVGLVVPGAGATVSREGALAALERGQVERALLGGRPSGERRIRVLDLPDRNPIASRLPPYILVDLPPPGPNPNTRRYAIRVVAAGYHGILSSGSTRIPGLVSIADVAQTAQALAEHRRASIRPHEGDAGDLRRLDRQLRHAHDVRSGAVGIAAGVLAVLGTLAFLLRLARMARIAVLFGVAAVSASLLTSGFGLQHRAPVLLGLAALSLGIAVAGSFLPRRPIVVAVLLALFLVLSLDTPLNSFGPLGPHPEGGGRFYGVGNLEETLLLAPVLAAAAGPWLVPVGALAIVTVGWSHAGADGGGTLVLAVALGVLALRLRGIALTPKRLALVAGGAVLLGLALVGLDAALGGSSHVTRAVSSGSVFDDIGHRLHLSYAVVTSSWHKGFLFLLSIGGMAWFAAHRDRGPVLEALLAGVAVSLVVNDTPVDVAGIGALGALALLAWERTLPSVDSRPMRRGLLAFAVVPLLLAGCGKEGTVRAAPNTVVGSVKQEAPGKAVFAAQGCNGCHTYAPAASQAVIGPNLDNLAKDAKTAKKPVDAYTRESILNPNAYVVKGFPKGVMPTTYKSLPQGDVDALVEFLTKPQG